MILKYSNCINYRQYKNKINKIKKIKNNLIKLINIVIKGQISIINKNSKKGNMKGLLKNMLN